LCWRCRRAAKDRELEGRVYDRGYTAGYWAGIADGERQAGARDRLDAGLLRDLVQLCHPDGHPPERAALANRTTTTLTELLARERSAAA
jgi:hypothetical protein